MKKYINTPEQKEKSPNKSPETNPEVTEIYNLNEREFKIVIIKKLSKLQENSESLMISGIKLMNRVNSSENRLKLLKKKQSEVLEMKNTVNQIKKNLESLNNRAGIMEEIVI